ncbi:SKI2, partial [Symbiodinium necroappetens]
LQRKQENSKCHGCALKHTHYEQLGARRSLAADIEDLDRELGAESLGLLPQLRAKEQVLRDLQCLDEDGLISFKGQAATEVLSGDEITVAEVVFHNILEGHTPEEVAAAVTAFVFPDKVEMPEDAKMEELPESLATVRQAEKEYEEVEWESLKLCREQAPLVALAGNMEENAAEQPNQVPALHLLDHPFEPFLTYEMVSADRQWMRAVVGLMRWRDVPARPHACAKTCTECCQLHNASWRVAACDAQRVPGQLCPCRNPDILPPLPEMPESPSSLEGRASN